VVSQILTMVADGDLVVGDKLPPERDLAVRLEVSRASIRQALSALEVFGTIQVRPGSGIYIANTSRHSIGGEATTVTELTGPLEILEAREIWEPTVARLAAQRRIDDDLAAMDALNVRLEDELAHGREGWEADWGFHLALGQATHNLSIRTITMSFTDQMNGPIWALMRARNLEVRPHAMRYLEDHKDILAAVRNRDPDAAEVAMNRHFANIMTDLDSEQGLGGRVS
jgi:DNA-binding FadR family transcriptional regulator